MLVIGFGESSNSAPLSSSTISECFSSAILISVYSVSKLERLGTRHERATPDLYDRIYRSHFEDRICRQKIEVCKANDKKPVFRINLMTELELCTEFLSHNFLHKTEFVDNNLKSAYEMTMEFND